MKQGIFGLLAVAISFPAAVACSGASSTPPEPYSSDGKAATTSSANVPPHAATAAAPPASGTSGAGATADPKAGATPKDPTTKTPSPAQNDGEDGEDGADGASIMASGEHCCFNGKYLRCPNAAACMGGVDVDACMDRCGFADVRCITDCANKAGTGAGPVGCDANAKPPAGVDCANGTIDLRN